MGGMEKEIDRISQLPDEVLTRILSLVPCKEVARAKLVSKTWRKLFEFLQSFTFEFPYSCSPPSYDSIINAIDSALKLQKQLTLDELKLRLDLDLIASSSLVESWIDVALERKVRDLDLCFLAASDVHQFPSKVFRTRTITDLRLNLGRRGLKICGDIDLPALRKLYLEETGCENEVIQKLISSCPLIQDLKILSCSGMRGLRVSGLVNLQRLCVKGCYYLESIEIDAPSLRYLEYHHGCRRCDFLLTNSCEFIKELRLYDRDITEDLFKNLLSRLPNLELLDMNRTELQRIEISHRKLKRLQLAVTNRVKESKLDTPNLRSLEYSGHRIHIVSILSSLSSSSLQELRLGFFKNNTCSQFFIRHWKEFLEKRRHPQDMKLHLHVKSKRGLMIPTKLRPILSPPVYDIKHLSLRVYEFSRYQYIIDRILWMCHPQILSISSGSNPRFIKVLYTKFTNKEEHPKCCTSSPVKCWRHYLEKVHIDDESIVKINKIIAMSESSNKVAIKKCEFRFELKWRYQLL